MLCYLNIVVVAGVGALDVEGVEGQVDDPVDRHLYGPQAVHPGFVAPVQVWIGGAKHAHRHGQVATAALVRTCEKHRETDSLHRSCKSATKPCRETTKREQLFFS